MTSKPIPLSFYTNVKPYVEIGAYVTDGHRSGILVGYYDTSYGRYGQVENGDTEYQVALAELVDINRKV